MKLRLAFTAVLVPLLLVATVQADQPYPVYVTPVPAVAPTATAYSGPVTVVQRPAMPAYTHPSAPVVYQPATVLPVPTTVYRPAVGVAPVPVTVYRPGVSAAPVPTTVYRPAAVAVPAAVVVPAAPAVAFYSPLTGWEVRVPGQPVRNFFRAIIP